MNPCRSQTKTDQSRLSVYNSAYKVSRHVHWPIQDGKLASCINLPSLSCGIGGELIFFDFLPFFFFDSAGELRTRDEVAAAAAAAAELCSNAKCVAFCKLQFMSRLAFSQTFRCRVIVVLKFNNMFIKI